MALLTADLRDHLGMHFPSIKWYQGPHIPDYPRKMGIVTPAPGGGFDMEMAMDRPGYQIRLISRQGDPNTVAAEVESDIYAVEQYLLTLPQGAVIGGHRVASVQRFGSQPTNLPIDTSNRVHFVVTVLVFTESGY